MKARYAGSNSKSISLAATKEILFCLAFLKEAEPGTTTIGLNTLEVEKFSIGGVFIGLYFLTRPSESNQNRDGRELLV